MSVEINITAWRQNKRQKNNRETAKKVNAQLIARWHIWQSS